MVTLFGHCFDISLYASCRCNHFVLFIYVTVRITLMVLHCWPTQSISWQLLAASNRFCFTVMCEVAYCDCNAGAGAVHFIQVLNYSTMQRFFLNSYLSWSEAKKTLAFSHKCTFQLLLCTCSMMKLTPTFFSWLKFYILVSYFI